MKLAPDLDLPTRVVTEKLGFLGRTGSGKTYAAKKLAELMHEAGAQFVVLDPVGVWYGLRLAEDGKRPGLPIPVLGGLRGDIPLEPTGGALIANLVVDRGTSVILDVSQFESDADKARFAHAFADRFFFRKKAAPSAVHVFIEEAQEFVPQNPQREEARMLHAFTRLVKIGRNFGIGVSLISQRPQEVNKKVLNLTELLFAFQLTGPQERKTIEGWIADKGLDEDISGELPKLAVGHPHVWSPAWLKISRVVAIAKTHTFDASSTPVLGKQATARELSPIDLEMLRKEMAATIERAKADDPRALRAELATAKAELAKLKAAPVPRANERVKEVPVLKGADIKRLENAAGKIDRAMVQLGKWSQAFVGTQTEVRNAAAAITDGVARLRGAPAAPPPRPAPAPAPMPRAHEEPAPRRASAAPLPDGGALPGPERKILTALAQHGPRLVPALARLTGYVSTGGAFKNPLSRLRTKGHVVGHGQEPIRITDEGLDALGTWTPLPTGRELLEWWLGTLPGPERKILRVVAGKYPASITVHEVAAATDPPYEPTGGAFKNPLSRLRTLGLISGRAEVRLAEELVG